MKKKFSYNSKVFKQARGTRYLSMPETATMCKLSLPAYTRLENGSQTSFRTIRKAIEGLELTPSEIETLKFVVV